jgi:glycosyltransferase involved in cell wall biosynthesis
MKLSIVLATRNEEKNISECLKSVKDIAGEIIVVDEESSDKTREIAESYGAKVTTVKHEPIFHKTKQKAIEKAVGDWIFQIDADERVSASLAQEITEVVNSSNEELVNRVLWLTSSKKYSLFSRHQHLIEQREGKLGHPTGEVVAFFVPRRNIFLGKPLIHGGVYPDGVIRLIKNGKARLPAKSVHELMEIDGEVDWLVNDLEHHDSPTLERYLERNNRYTDLIAKDLKKEGVPANYWNFFVYSFIKPTVVFLSLYLRHKGILDGMRGFIWSMFSALRFPIAYFKYFQSVRS